MQGPEAVSSLPEQTARRRSRSTKIRTRSKTFSLATQIGGSHQQLSDAKLDTNIEIYCVPLVKKKKLFMIFPVGYTGSSRDSKHERDLAQGNFFNPEMKETL